MTTNFADATIWVGMLALGSAWWALWVRRDTWGHYFETAATVAVTLNGIGLLVASTYATNTLGRWLYDVTGVGGLTNFMGHLLALGGTAAFIVHMQIRDPKIGRDPQALHDVIHQRLCLPLTFVVMVLLFLVVQAPATNRGPVDLALVHCGPWMTMYWLAFGATCSYLETYLALLLLEMRRDDRSRPLADTYLVAVLFSFIAIAICVVTRLYDDQTNEHYMWLFGCLSVALFHIGTGYSWITKKRRNRKHDIMSDPLRIVDLQGMQGIPAPDASPGDLREGNRDEPPQTSGP